MIEEYDGNFSNEFLRKMRNDIVGSAENKIEYIRSNKINR